MAVVLVSVEGSPAALAAVAARAVAVPSPASLVGRPRPPILEVPPGIINIRVSPRGVDLGDPRDLLRQKVPVPHDLKLKWQHL